DVQARAELAQVERPLEALLRAVDHAAVVAEHEAADRRDCDDRDDEAQVDPCVPPVAHSRCPFGCELPRLKVRFEPAAPAGPARRLEKRTNRRRASARRAPLRTGPWQPSWRTRCADRLHRTRSW